MFVEIFLAGDVFWGKYVFTFFFLCLASFLAFASWGEIYIYICVFTFFFLCLASFSAFVSWFVFFPSCFFCRKTGLFPSWLLNLPS